MTDASPAPAPALASASAPASAPTPADGPDAFDYTLLTVGAANFAMSFLLTKVGLAVDGIGGGAGFAPLTFVALRLLVATFVLWVVMRAVGEALPPVGDREAWWLIVGTALFGNALPFGLITWGQAVVPASLTSIFVAVMPLTTVVLAHLAGDERLTPAAVIGCLLGLAGVAVLMGWDALALVGEDAWRQWAIVGAAVSFAVNAVLMRRMRGRSMRAMSLGMIAVGCAMVAPFALLGAGAEAGTGAGVGAWQVPGAAAWWALAAAAVFPTAIGTLIIINISKRAGAPFLGQINFLVPIFGVGFAALFLGETIEPRAGLALALVLAGIAVARIRRTPQTIARGRA